MKRQYVYFIMSLLFYAVFIPDCILQLHHIPISEGMIIFLKMSQFIILVIFFYICLINTPDKEIGVNTYNKGYNDGYSHAQIDRDIEAMDQGEEIDYFPYPNEQDGQKNITS